MTDATREDFKRWATAEPRRFHLGIYDAVHGFWPGEYHDVNTEIAWQAYQQGIADARKPSTETAAEWIGRHRQEYALPFFDESDAVKVAFSTNELFSDFTLTNDWGFEVSRNLETADDCIKLCELLRVTPVERAQQ